MTMTNKQYKQAREEHQEAEELYTFEFVVLTTTANVTDFLSLIL